MYIIHIVSVLCVNDSAHDIVVIKCDFTDCCSALKTGGVISQPLHMTRGECEVLAELIP